MQIEGKVAVVTGAGSGIGMAASMELAKRGCRGIALVDLAESAREVAHEINSRSREPVAHPFIGDATSPEFRRRVYDEIEQKVGVPAICVPAAGITRDALAVRLDKTTGKASVYDEKLFRQVLEVNLLAPVYWALEMVARIAQERHLTGLGAWKQGEEPTGTVIYIGSVSAQGNKGQIAYAATKRGLEGVASTMMKEAMYWGVRCGVIHPGFTNTKMVAALGDEYIQKYIIPFTQLKRLIEPEEIADAICFMISNSAVSGELWCDAGWHPSA